MINQNINHKFAALGDQTRTEIVELLREHGELRVSEIATEFTASRQSITKHIDILQGAGIVKCKKAGRERFTRLSPTAFNSIAKWMGHYDKFWDNKLDKLKGIIEKENQ